jgi:hypothetical protein
MGNLRMTIRDSNSIDPPDHTESIYLFVNQLTYYH